MARLSIEDRHYLGALLYRMKKLYRTARSPRTREQLSDEIDWLNEKLGIKED